GGLGDHDCGLPGGPVGVGGVERGVLCAGLVGRQVDAFAGGVAADGAFVGALAEAGLAASVGGIAGARVGGELGCGAGLGSEGLEVGPAGACDVRWVLADGSDLDQAGAGGVDEVEELALFAGPGERRFVVNDGGVLGELDATGGDRGGQCGGGISVRLNTGGG